MTAPMILLAGLSIGAGFLGATVWKGGFASWIHIPGLPEEHFEWGAAAISVIVAAAGLAIGYALYRRYREPDPIRRLGPLYTLWSSASTTWTTSTTRGSASPSSTRSPRAPPRSTGP